MKGGRATSRSPSSTKIGTELAVDEAAAAAAAAAGMLLRYVPSRRAEEEEEEEEEGREAPLVEVVL